VYAAHDDSAVVALGVGACVRGVAQGAPTRSSASPDVRCLLCAARPSPCCPQHNTIQCQHTHTAAGHSWRMPPGAHADRLANRHRRVSVSCGGSGVAAGVGCDRGDAVWGQQEQRESFGPKRVTPHSDEHHASSWPLCFAPPQHHKNLPHWYHIAQYHQHSNQHSRASANTSNSASSHAKQSAATGPQNNSGAIRCCCPHSLPHVAPITTVMMAQAQLAGEP
jgi:hypothetical protein